MTVVNAYNNKNFSIYIGRPPQGGEWRFGNPFVIGRDGDRKEVVFRFKIWLETGDTFDCTEATKERRQWILDHLKDLKKDDVLGCFCAPLLCHGNVLIELSEKKKRGRPRKI